MQLPVSVHEADPVPVDQPAKDELASGVAVRFIVTPELYISEQSVPQLMPVAVTIPVPEPDFVIFKATGVSNIAVIAVSLFIITVQVPVPLQPPPDQPANTELAFGVAVSVITAPVANISPQSVPQFIPPGVLVTTPDPVPALDMESRY